MEREVKIDRRRGGADRRLTPRGGRRDSDRVEDERERRQQQVDKYLRKPDTKQNTSSVVSRRQFEAFA